MNKRFSIPSKFQNDEDNQLLNNSNFHPAKVCIMSTGKNWNGSSFSLESLEIAKDTVAYAPILASIVERNDGEEDCNGHDLEYDYHVDADGEVTYKETYIEKPVGVFCSNSAYIEQKGDKSYLICKGYIWKQYSSIYDILKRDGVKDVSVEIMVEEGNFTNEDDYYHINKFEIMGCTILGNGIQPAIPNSRIEFNFSKEDNQEYFNNLNQLKELLNQEFEKEGEDNMDKDKKEFEVCDKCGNEPCTCDDNKDDNFAEDENKDEVCPICGNEPCTCDEENDDTEDNAKKKKKCSTDESEPKMYTQEEYDAVVNELKELREFKANYDRAVEKQELENNVNEVLGNFSLDEEDTKELKEKVLNKEISLESFELQLFRLQSKNPKSTKKDFSKDDEKEKINEIPIIDSKKDNSGYDIWKDYRL